ncbi:hypothetical protein F070042J6_18400 [Bacteroides sp. f07]
MTSTNTVMHNIVITAPFNSAHSFGDFATANNLLPETKYPNNNIPEKNAIKLFI